MIPGSVVHGIRTIGPVAGPSDNSSVTDERLTVRMKPTCPALENPAKIAGDTTDLPSSLAGNEYNMSGKHMVALFKKQKILSSEKITKTVANKIVQELEKNGNPFLCAAKS